MAFLIVTVRIVDVVFDFSGGAEGVFSAAMICHVAEAYICHDMTCPGVSER